VPHLSQPTFHTRGFLNPSARFRRRVRRVRTQGQRA